MSTVTQSSWTTGPLSVRGKSCWCCNTRIPARPARRSVMVRWTREEYELLLEDEDVQAFLAVNPRKRRLTPPICTLPEGYKLTDKHGRKSWAMDDVWEQYRRKDDPEHQEDATDDEDKDEQAPCTNAANGGRHAAKSR